MNTLLAILGLCLTPAHADISDSGPLTIGAQGIIAGTMTVQGSAFSVGGSSFVVSGGSVTAAYSLTAGSLRLNGSTGTFVSQSSVTASSFFGDGSHLTGVTVGGASLTADQTFSGTNTFSTYTYLQSAWSTRMDTTTVSGYLLWSVDGAVQSSGCVVDMHFDSTRNQMVITSTTTDPSTTNMDTFCVLAESCAPSTYCKCATRGLVRIKVVTGSKFQAVTTSTTRCQSVNNSYVSNAACLTNSICTGQYVTSPDANGFVYAILKGP